MADPVELQEPQAQLIEMLRKKTGRFGGCWDLLVWKDGTILFIELKRLKKDKIQSTQTEWFDAALNSGLIASNFALIEWKIGSVPKDEDGGIVLA